jgi:hypothetical protein
LVHERVAHLCAHVERKGASGMELVRICRATAASVMPSREERLGFGESEAAAAEAPAGGGGLGEGLRKGRVGGVQTDAPQIARRRRREDGRVSREWRAGDGGATSA